MDIIYTKYKINVWFKNYFRGFPGSPVVKTPCFHYRGQEFDLGWGTKFPQTVWCGYKKKKKERKKEKKVLAQTSLWLHIRE